MSPCPFILFLPQDKQNEASYLRDHRQELAEELAGTILQRVGQFKPASGELERRLRMGSFADAVTKVKGA